MDRPPKPGTKPILDEATFQRLLASAYVIQEHLTGLRTEKGSQPGQLRGAAPSESEYARTLGEIIETQNQILMRRLDLDDAAGLIVEQLHRLSSAAGAAIALLDHDHLVYRAVSGVSLSDLGSALPKDQVPSSSVISEGMVLRCGDLSHEPGIDWSLALSKGLHSFVAVPIFHDYRATGVLEIVYSEPQAFTEYDVRTCQMMAGLITEALSRTESEQWKRALGAERDSMLEALEKLKPQLDRLAQQPTDQGTGVFLDTLRRAIKAASPGATSSENKKSPSTTGVMGRVAGGDQCEICGHELAPEEVYCGSCGTLRERRLNETTAPIPANGSRVMSQSDKSYEDAVSASPHPALEPIELPEEILALTNAEDVPAGPKTDVADELFKLLPPEPWIGEDTPREQTAGTSKTVPVKQELAASPWASAAKAQEWLKSLSDPKSKSNLSAFIADHRGDIALAIAVLVVIGVFFRQSGPSPVSDKPAKVPASSAQLNAAPAAAAESSPESRPELSLWDRALISLGIAEPPASTPIARPTGNPAVNVWVDMRTALYYCPGAELYGKTQKGKFTTQREAQSDRFEPASGQVCE